MIVTEGIKKITSAIVSTEYGGCMEEYCVWEDQSPPQNSQLRKL